MSFPSFTYGVRNDKINAYPVFLAIRKEDHMRRYFNTEGRCKPDIHYMVRLDERLGQIRRQFVDRGRYFVINRGRQYGKTTTLMELADYLKEDYVVLSMDFQGISFASFENEQKFVTAFIRDFVKALKNERAGTEGNRFGEKFKALEGKELDLGELFLALSRMCEESERPVVLMIDEVDSASNNQIFLDFLALLRRYYLDREDSPTFHSVILAGVYDIKNLKLKLRPDDEHRYNSPWNIAARFELDMSFSVKQISAMLAEYEEDCRTGMDVGAVSSCIYEYTSGYPYLVSAVCKLLDEELPGNEKFADVHKIWTREGIAEAVSMLLDENVLLFDSMTKQIHEYPEIKLMLQAILFQGKRLTYNPDNPAINLAAMFGYVVNEEKTVQVANRIFEMRLYNSFLSEEELTAAIYHEAQGNRNQFLDGCRLNMDLVLKKFVEYFTDIYGRNDEKFLEEHGRKLFLLYLKPIINGTGNYYVEARTRDARRTDIIVDYRGEQFIVELKIWRGNEYRERGERQLAEYLDSYHQEKGYLLSFNFNKKKEPGVRELRIGGKTIVEAMV